MKDEKNQEKKWMKIKKKWKINEKKNEVYIDWMCQIHKIVRKRIETIGIKMKQY